MSLIFKCVKVCYTNVKQKGRLLHLPTMPDLSYIRSIIAEVPDPEVPVITIEDLGILRDITLDDSGKITVHITPTYTGCPAMDMITVGIKSTLQDAGYLDVEVKLVLSPIWTTDWLTDKAKEKLRDYGIAPPAQRTTDAAFIHGISPEISCPQCHSTDTEMISHFGSTACKALYKCHTCLEPFDYFKCH
jgi:ring-1,2-phenylacetyl-CoA epoxidase subunit PaaD